MCPRQEKEKRVMTTRIDKYVVRWEQEQSWMMTPHGCIPMGKFDRWLDVGDFILVDPSDYRSLERKDAAHVEMGLLFCWARVTSFAAGTAAAYPVRAELEDGQIGQYKTSEILAVQHGGAGEPEYWRDAFTSKSPIFEMYKEVERYSFLDAEDGTGQTALNLYVTVPDGGRGIILGVYRDGTLWTDLKRLGPELEGGLKAALSRVNIVIGQGEKEWAFWATVDGEKVRLGDALNASTLVELVAGVVKPA